MDPELMAEVINALLERGFQFPLYLSAVAVNGAVIVVRYRQNEEEDVEVTVLAEHSPDPGFVLPINIMVSDHRGEAARVVIQRPAEWQFAGLN